MALARTTTVPLRYTLTTRAWEYQLRPPLTVPPIAKTTPASSSLLRRTMPGRISPVARRRRARTSWEAIRVNIKTTRTGSPRWALKTLAPPTSCWEEEVGSWRCFTFHRVGGLSTTRAMAYEYDSHIMVLSSSTFYSLFLNSDNESSLWKQALQEVSRIARGRIQLLLRHRRRQGPHRGRCCRRGPVVVFGCSPGTVPGAAHGRGSEGHGHHVPERPPLKVVV
jgi:hypothetical protein